SSLHEPVAVDGCNCKRSKCLKLYCQCFAMQVVCTASCNCHHCYNNVNQESLRLQAINGVLERNPAAFDAKFKETEVRGEDGAM
ncbi:unnamed protein product, partial [Hapterophycus canaliculatus]